MATYSQLKTRVENDLNRADFSVEVSFAVHNAIRHYEQERWPWLDDITTLPVVAGTTWVGAPLDIRDVDLLLFQDADARYEIKRSHDRTLERVDLRTASIVGDPISFYLSGDRIRLYPANETSANLVLFYSRSLTQTGPLADATSNAWTNIASEMVYARAAKITALTKLHDPEMAKMFDVVETDEYNTLRSGIDRRSTLGRAARYNNWSTDNPYLPPDEER